MNFIVTEIQTNNGVSSVLTSTHSDLQEAYSKYYTVLGFAAVSTIECHAASLMTETGEHIKHDVFRHEVPEPVVAETPVEEPIIESIENTETMGSE